MAEWCKTMLDLESGDPWFKSCTLPLSGFVFSPKFNSATGLCKLSTVQPPTYGDSQ